MYNIDHVHDAGSFIAKRDKTEMKKSSVPLPGSHCLLLMSNSGVALNTPRFYSPQIETGVF